jgi:Mrp family chromosome partitioning ATPase
MLALHKRKKQPPAQDGTITLRAADDTPLYTFPSEVVNSVRHMETVLISKGRLPARISIVAALQGEGVTYTTLALATALSYDLAVRVCVVELNWWSPQLNAPPTHKAHVTPDTDDTTVIATPSDTPSSIVEATGLAAVLMGAATIDNVLIPTALPNLALLPAGRLSPAQRPVMARSDALKACIEQLSQRFDHVLLDIPAILATSDSIALASLGNTCCVVIRQGVTPVSSVRRALNDIKHLPMLGVVLNQTRNALPRWVSAFVPQE